MTSSDIKLDLKNQTNTWLLDIPGARCRQAYRAPKPSGALACSGAGR